MATKLTPIPECACPVRVLFVVFGLAGGIVWLKGPKDALCLQAFGHSSETFGGLDRRLPPCTRTVTLHVGPLRLTGVSTV